MRQQSIFSASLRSRTTAHRSALVERGQACDRGAIASRARPHKVHAMRGSTACAPFHAGRIVDSDEEEDAFQPRKAARRAALGDRTNNARRKPAGRCPSRVVKVSLTQAPCGDEDARGNGASMATEVAVAQPGGPRTATVGAVPQFPTDSPARSDCDRPSRLPSPIQQVRNITPPPPYFPLYPACRESGVEWGRSWSLSAEISTILLVFHLI
jgi:hypothetical protein